MQNPKTLLLVNDDPRTLRLLGKLLGLAGFSVLLAANAFDAIRTARRDKPDLVVTDILMRGMDGLELCRVIRSDVALSAIPVILISNLNPTREDLTLAKSVGAHAFVPMSSDVSDLLREIRKALG